MKNENDLKQFLQTSLMDRRPLVDFGIIIFGALGTVLLLNNIIYGLPLLFLSIFMSFGRTTTYKLMQLVGL